MKTNRPTVAGDKRPERSRDGLFFALPNPMHRPPPPGALASSRRVTILNPLPYMLHFYALFRTPHSVTPYSTNGRPSFGSCLIVLNRAIENNPSRWFAAYYEINQTKSNQIKP